MFGSILRKGIDNNSMISLTHCKNCRRKLKDERYKLYNKEDLFIGFRCPKCYKKFDSFLVGYIVCRKMKDRKNNPYYQAFFEQKTRKNDISQIPRKRPI